MDGDRAHAGNELDVVLGTWKRGDGGWDELVGHGVVLLVRGLATEKSAGKLVSADAFAVLVRVEGRAVGFIVVLWESTEVS